MKLLFVCNNLHIGGIQKSLLNLLNEICDLYDITLFLFFPEGELKKDLPKNIKVISGNCFTKVMGMSQAEAKKNGFFTMLWRSFWAVMTKIFGIGFSFGILTKMQKLRGVYDAAISFSQNSSYKMFYGGCNEFVINSVKAKKKISFVHCDFLNYIGNNPYNKKYYKNFDAIACVSNSCKAVFDSVCPDYKNKTYTVHNCYNFKMMEEYGGKYEAEYTEGKINLFTAARISEEKGIFRMFTILSDLKRQGVEFVWRIAGAGPLFEKAVEDSKKYGLEEDVVFLNMIDNPYPYFKKSDLLLVPSYDEAAPMVFGEAAFFGLPVLTTDTTSAKEMVLDEGLGFVCKNDDNDIKETLLMLLKNPHIIKGKNKKISNEKAIKEFKNLIMNEG